MFVARLGDRLRARERIEQLRVRAPWLFARRVHIAATVVVVLLTIGWSRWAFDALRGKQQPRLFPDSVVYLQTAALPTELDHFHYPKPFTVPAVYRKVDANPERIVAFQRELAFASWWLFGVALVATLRRTRARALALVVTVGFVLAPIRLGWTATILSESITDSLMALVLAASLGLSLAATRLRPGPWRTAACAALASTVAILGAAWIFSRDTNAIAALVMVGVAAIAWRPYRAAGSRAWSLSLAAVVVVLSLLSIRSAGVTPSTPTDIGWNRDWQPEALPRSALPMVNNLFHRVLPNPEAVAFFRARGMPWSDELAAFSGYWAIDHEARFLKDPTFVPVLRWLRDHGTSTWALWLLEHPLERADEVIGAQWSLLGDGPLVVYMPPAWRADWRGHPIADFVRHVPTRRFFILLLIVVAPLLVRGARAPLRGIAGCTIAGALIALPAAYYGDAMEVERHCYGSAQQLVIGLLLLALARADAPDLRKAARPLHSAGAP